MAQRLLLRAVLGFLKTHHGPARADQRRSVKQGPKVKIKIELFYAQRKHPLGTRPVCFMARNRALQSDGCEAGATAQRTGFAGIDKRVFAGLRLRPYT